jgi:hypothetical protein
LNTDCPIKKTDAARQMVWSEVYCPLVPDSQGDYMTAVEIEQTAHNFMRGQRLYNVDTEHSLQKNDSCVIESFIARPGDPEFIPGSWVVGIHVVNPATWAAIEKGDINGLSMYGSGSREDRVIEIEIPDDGIIKGDTHDYAGHKHQFYLQLNEQGKVVKGHTDAITLDGVAHSHLIKGGTVTEPSHGHSHRYSVSDALSKIMSTA